MPTRALGNWSSGGKVYFPKQSLTRLIAAQGIRPSAVRGGLAKKSENIYRNIIKCRTYKMEMKGKEIENGPSRTGGARTTPKVHPAGHAIMSLTQKVKTKRELSAWVWVRFNGWVCEWVCVAVCSCVGECEWEQKNAWSEGRQTGTKHASKSFVCPASEKQQAYTHIHTHKHKTLTHPHILTERARNRNKDNYEDSASKRRKSFRCSNFLSHLPLLLLFHIPSIQRTTTPHFTPPTPFSWANI